MSWIKPHIGTLAAAAIVSLLSFLASKALGQSYPVNSYIMTTDQWEFTKTTARNSFTGVRVRNCKALDDSISGMAIVGGVMVEQGVGLTHTSQLINVTTKGNAYFGSIVWQLNDMPRANKLGFRMAYQCKDQKIWAEYWYQLPLDEDRLYLYGG